MAKWISLILLKRIMQCKTVNKDWICSNVQIDKRRHEECYLFLLIFIFIANWVEYNSVLGLRVTRYSQNFIRLSANRSFGRSLAVISTVIFIFGQQFVESSQLNWPGVESVQMVWQKKVIVQNLIDDFRRFFGKVPLVIYCS